VRSDLSPLWKAEQASKEVNYGYFFFIQRNERLFTSLSGRCQHGRSVPANQNNSSECVVTDGRSGGNVIFSGTLAHSCTALPQRVREVARRQIRDRHDRQGTCFPLRLLSRLWPLHPSLHPSILPLLSVRLHPLICPPSPPFASLI